MPKARSARRGLLADRGDLDPGEGPRVQAVLLELLPDRADRVHRGERDPLVPAGDQALDRPLHLLRGARRLDRDGRHLLRHRAVGAQPLRRRCRPAPWSAAPAPASRTAAWSRTRTAACCAATASPTTATAGPCAVSRLTPAALRSAATEPSVRHHGVLLGGGAVPGDRERRGVRPARRDEHLGRCRPGPASAPRIDQAARARRSTRLTSAAWMIPHVAAGRRRSAGCRRRRAPRWRRHAGHDLEARPRPWRRPRPPSAAAAEQERVAGEQPDRELARLGRLDQQLRVLRPGPAESATSRPARSRWRDPVDHLRSADHQVWPRPAGRRRAGSAGPRRPGPAPTKATQAAAGCRVPGRPAGWLPAGFCCGVGLTCRSSPCAASV